MLILLQSTIARVVGRGYLSSDHFSTATGLDPAFTISKNGGAFANPAAGASVMTEIETTGWYYFALGTADTDTLGPLIIRGTHATMDNIEVVCQVVATVTAANVTQVNGAAQTATLDTIKAETAGIEVHVHTTIPGTLTTIADYLDTEIAAILEDTGTTLPAAFVTLDAVVDTVKVDTAAILVDTGTDIPATLSTIAGYIDTEVAAIKTKTDTLGGAGAITWDYTLTEEGTGLPIADADIWVTTDIGGANIIGSGKTNAFGIITFYLDAGTVYVWRQKSGWNFTNPDSEVVA